MGHGGSIDPFGGGMGEAFGDAPLFRELQRVLSSSSGPVNWELARQVGIATASWGTDDEAPREQDRRDFADTVRLAELAVADLTNLPMPSDLAVVRAIRRAEWVEANIRDLRDVLDPVASKLAGSMESLGGPDALGLGPGLGDGGGFGAFGAGAQHPAIGFGPAGDTSSAAGDDEDPGSQAQMFRQLMGTLAPLLMGAQVGTVLGTLAQRVLGQFDLAVPTPSGELLFVVPNIVRFESDWSLPAREFRAYVAVHEVTHRFEFAQAWVRPHFLDMVRDLVDHAEVDVAGLQQRLETLDPSNPEAMRQAMEGAGNLFGTSDDPEQRLRIARLQAFMAAAEGYGDHVTRAIGRRMLSSFEQIEEAIKRHREGRDSEGALERLLGLEVTAEQYRLGEEFCSKVVEATDEPTLSRMWGSADSMPSMPELEEPTLWLSRTV